MWCFKFICIIFMSVSVTSDEKGFLNVSRRVYLGSRSSIINSPYLAIVFWSNHKLRCGASILNPQFLVSGAHCFPPGNSFYIRVGTDIITGGESYDIDRVFIHPRHVYIPGIDVYYYDVAVVKLRRLLRYSERVQPIALAPVNFVGRPGMMMETFGYGQHEQGDVSPYLLRAIVPYINPRDCGNLLTLQVTPDMFCARGLVCYGDSGGPLVYNNMLVGTVSFGRKCGGSLPEVYASVPFLRDFIVNTVRTNS